MRLTSEERAKIEEEAKKEYMDELKKIRKAEARQEAKYHGQPFFIVWIKKLFGW